MIKICKDCAVEKNIDEFYTGSRRCRECARIFNRKNYDPEIAYKKRLNQKEKDPEKWGQKKKEYNLKYENKNKKLINEKKRKYQRERRNRGLVIVNRLKAIEGNRKWREKYPEKKKARYILTSKLNRNLIEKPLNCQVCNAIEKLEGHHHDYSKPLDVIWCCKKCHGSFHVKLIGE